MLLLPLRTVFDKNEWYLRHVNKYLAESMVQRYHYTKHCSSWRVYTFGLFLKGDPNCWGVSWWIPAAKRSVDKYNPGKYKTTLLLHRMVIHPLVPTNGASFLLGRSIRLIEQYGRFDLLMTYADTWAGHTGAIYYASNWDYRGMSKPSEVWMDRNGVLVSKYAQGRTVPSVEMERRGYHRLGRFAKHIFTMSLKTKPQLEQLALWAA